MTLRVLLSVSGPEDILYLCDVLTEMDGGRCWSDWVNVESIHAATLADTAAILAAETVDILLLDLELRDSHGPDTFRRIHAAAPDLPVILLVEASATPLAERMVREGCQDFLVKKDVDCEPLARALRNALERHRLLAAARATSMTDPLTGLLTHPAFETLAERDRILGGRLGRRMLVLVAECLGATTLNGGEHVQPDQHRDLALVQAADDLRSLAGPAALVARIGNSRFAVAILDTVAEPIEDIQARLQAAAANTDIAFGAAVFDPLCPASLDALLEEAAQSLSSHGIGQCDDGRQCKSLSMRPTV